MKVRAMGLGSDTGNICLNRLITNIVSLLMENQRDRALTRVDSDVGIGNAEICSVTANSSQV